MTTLSFLTTSLVLILLFISGGLFIAMVLINASKSNEKFYAGLLTAIIIILSMGLLHFLL